MNTIDQLLQTDRRAVDIPGVDGPLYVRSLLVADRLALADAQNQEWALLYLCVENEAGERVFESADQAARLPLARATVLIEAINVLNGWDQAAVEEATKN
jgi:hypothetical protein